MFLVGLTGGIASGKSTVADRLAQHGAEVIDADELAREVVLPGTPTLRRIVEHFGPEVLDEDGFLDRARLAGIVFADDAQRAVLNELTHPPILRAIAQRLELLAHVEGLVVLDIALLVEVAVELAFDAVVVVTAAPEVQQRRLVERRGMSPEEAAARIAAQAPPAQRLSVATHVIDNDDTLKALLARTDEVAAELIAAAGFAQRGGHT